LHFRWTCISLLSTAVRDLDGVSYLTNKEFALSHRWRTQFDCKAARLRIIALSQVKVVRWQFSGEKLCEKFSVFVHEILGGNNLFHG